MPERRFLLVDFTYMNRTGYLRLSKFIYAPTSKRHVLQDAGEPRRVRLHVHGRRADRRVARDLGDRLYRCRARPGA